eukprot:9283410-Alexandrium_andersonii.AAC.1
MSAKMDYILEEYPLEGALPSAAADEYERACFAYMACQNAAAQHYNAADHGALMLYDVTIKSH